ncbi:MAG: G5 domain-containing protein [Candidatus Wallbacteria bacterium]|nr:G5 domain-containing protein [Candidatus Wallbacteria bacterium]
MLIPLSGNYRIRDILSLPLISFLVFLSFTIMFFIACDFLAPKCFVTIMMPDYKLSLLTRAGNVREALNDAGIDLEKNYLVIPDLTSALNSNCVIQVIKVQNQIVCQTSFLSPSTPEIKKTKLLAYGEQRVIWPEQQGKKITYYQETYFNYQMISKKIIKESVINEPQRKLILLGIGDQNLLDNLRLSFQRNGSSQSIQSEISPDSCLYAPGCGYLYFNGNKSNLPANLNLVIGDAAGNSPKAFYIF